MRSARSASFFLFSANEPKATSPQSPRPSAKKHKSHPALAQKPTKHPVIAVKFCNFAPSVLQIGPPIAPFLPIPSDKTPQTRPAHRPSQANIQFHLTI